MTDDTQDALESTARAAMLELHQWRLAAALRGIGSPDEMVAALDRADRLGLVTAGCAECRRFG